MLVVGVAFVADVVLVLWALSASRHRPVICVDPGEHIRGLVISPQDANAAIGSSAWRMGDVRQGNPWPLTVAGC
jgi:hypothetical protein